MPLTNILLIFALSWWVVFFMVLPFGIEPQEQDVFGTSAPVKTHLRKKLLITTILAILVTVGIAYVIKSGWIGV